MSVAFDEALARLGEHGCRVCRYEFGPVSCFDEEPYERLGDMFAEAVAALTGRDGPPITPTPSFPGVDVERAACWRRDSGMVYAVLSWADNTRSRCLAVGFARRGTVVAGCWGTNRSADGWP